MIAGVDEAGRGPLAGPVCAAAVIIGGAPIHGLADSKQLGPRARAVAARHIRRQALCWRIGWAGVQEIEEHNILGASLLAMRRALSGLSIPPALVLVDGNRDPGCGLPTRCLIKGDKRYAAIAAASILAKVARDRYMRFAALAYPGYDFARNKGYPGTAHLESLKRSGACPLHRRAFAPVARVIANASD